MTPQSSFPHCVLKYIYILSHIKLTISNSNYYTPKIKHNKFRVVRKCHLRKSYERRKSSIIQGGYQIKK